MNVSASEFKAKCLALLDRVEASGEPITITKRGRVVAQLAPANPAAQPWRELRAVAAKWKGNPFEPVIDPSNVEAFK